MKNAIKKYLIESGFNYHESNETDVLFKDILKDIQVLFNISDKECNAYINVEEIDEEDNFPKYAVLQTFKEDVSLVENKEAAAQAVVSVMLQKVLTEYISR